jgi:hypothetical protein
MKKFLRCLWTCRKPILFLGLLCFLSVNSIGQITTPIASVSNPIDNAALDATTVAIAPPGSMVAGDLVVMIAHSRVTANTQTLNVTGGQTWKSEATTSTGNSTGTIFWCRFNGTWAANPSVNFATGTATGVVMHIFRPTTSTNLWAVDVAQQNVAYAATTNVAITGLTTIHSSTVTLASWFSTDDNTWNLLASPGWTTTGGFQYRVNSVNDNSTTYAHAIRTTPGATGNVTKQQATLGADNGQTTIISFYEYAPPANDACASSVLLTSGTTCTNTTGNLQYAASAAPAGACGGATLTTTFDVWYRFVANSTTHAITLSSLGAGLTAANTYIETFSGACGSLTSLGCQNATTPEVINGLTVGATYYVRVYVTTAPTGNTTTDWNFNICVQQPPANDDCTGAITLVSGASCVNTAGTLHVATSNSTGIPLGCFAAGTYYDVWYKFVATSTGHTVSLSSLGANITSPQIQIYSGTCGALVSLGCASGLNLSLGGLTSGATYYIRVANLNTDPTGAAGFNICVTANLPPANDACAGSILLVSGVACTNTTGNLQFATSAAPAGSCGGATVTTTYDVWYSFVANSTTHYVTLSGLGANLAAATTYIETFSGTCGSLTSLGCQNAATMQTIGGLTIGNTYYVRVYVTSAPNNATTANWNFSICIQQPPANDECTGAVALTPGAACVNTAGTLNLATVNASTPLGCFAPGNYYDVWYKFVATTTIETVTLSGLGANFTAPNIQIYSGTCGSLVSLGCASGTSLLKYGLTVGATYYVRIANLNVNPSGAGTVANFSICVTFITPPANDDCTGATTLTTATACVNTVGTLLNSSPTTGSLPACGNSGSADVWYKFIANSNRPVITLSGLGANLNAATTFIQLFSGGCGSLVPLACTLSPLNTAVTPGGVGLTYCWWLGL